MKFIRAGNLIINLDQVTHVKIGEDQSGVSVHFAGGKELVLQSPQSSAVVAATQPMEFHDVPSPR